MYRKRYRRLRIKLALICLLTAAALLGFELRMRPIIEQAAKTRVEASVGELVNQTVAGCIERGGVSYESLVRISYDDSRTVRSVECDTVALSVLISQLNGEIIKGMDGSRTGEVSVHLGTLLGGDFLRGRGPMIVSRFDYTGTATCALESSFDTAGINQTKHRLLLRVCVSVTVFLEKFITEQRLELLLPISETIIVGELPHSYTTIDLSGRELYKSE